MSLEAQRENEIFATYTFQCDGCLGLIICAKRGKNYIDNIKKDTYRFWLTDTDFKR